MQNYKGKTVIVTGGAGYIGKSITENYLRCGANVIICGRRPPPEPVAVDSNQAHFLAVDIRDPQQCEKLIAYTTETFGRLDVLVNNAGGTPAVDVAEASAELLQKIIQLNLMAPLLLSRLAYLAMSQQQEVGNIINIASVSGTRPSPGTTAYGAAKAGLLSATKSLAQEWGPKVRVNSIVVGLVRNEAAEEHYGGEQGFKQVENMLPMKRMAEPQDIADACLFLSSAEAGYISGASLEVDGGGEVPVFLHLAKNK